MVWEELKFSIHKSECSTFPSCYELFSLQVSQYFMLPNIFKARPSDLNLWSDDDMEVTVLLGNLPCPWFCGGEKFHLGWSQNHIVLSLFVMHFENPIPEFNEQQWDDKWSK